MVPMEGLFCPCCTSAILHTIAQSGTLWLSRQHLMLGTGSLIAAIGNVKKIPPSLSESPSLPIRGAKV
jgi:hypothetical protein